MESRGRCLWWGSRGQSPLVGSRGEAPGLACPPDCSPIRPWRDCATGGKIGRFCPRRPAWNRQVQSAASAGPAAAEADRIVRRHAKGAPSRVDHALRDAGQPDAVAGLHHRQCVAAVHAGQPVDQRRRDHLGADLLRHRGGDHDGAGRLAGGAVRAQEPAHRLHGRVRHRLDAVRHRRRSLEQMVVFRFMQGICGAALVPLSQATMLDIYPFERRAQAMAIFGMGVMVGPIIGPTLGGYLTEMYNWRYVFYVNLPFGMLAITGLLVFLPKALPRAGVEVRLDRLRRAGDGRRRVAAHARPRAGAGLVHLARDHRRGGAGRPRACICSSCTCSPPSGRSCRPDLFKDRNFVAGVTMVFFTATVMLASSALMAPYLETLAGYPVATAGLVDGAARPGHHDRRCRSPAGSRTMSTSARSWRAAC